MLITEKKYYFETSDGQKFHPYIREFFTKESQTIFTWPCSILLASYIAGTNITQCCRTIELGAGCGLPSIVAALAGAEVRVSLRVRFSDRVESFDNLQPLP
jgi:predicted nicotinamide N-methyase